MTRAMGKRERQKRRGELFDGELRLCGAMAELANLSSFARLCGAEVIQRDYDAALAIVAMAVAKVRAEAAKLLLED